jgi:hypothetical protein
VKTDFHVWYRRDGSKLAREYVNLGKEYNYAGIVRATSRTDALVRIHNNPTGELGDQGKPLRVGDMLCSDGVYFVYTLSGQWAEVRVLDAEDE